MIAKIPTTRTELLARMAEMKDQAPLLQKSVEEHNRLAIEAMERAKAEPKTTLLSATAAELAVFEASMHRLHTLVAATLLDASARESSYIARELDRTRGDN